MSGISGCQGKIRQSKKIIAENQENKGSKRSRTNFREVKANSWG